MPARIVFRSGSEEAAEQFVREYVIDAIDRAPEMEGCEGISFSLNEVPNPEGGSVIMTALGEGESFVNAEESRWKAHREAGRIETWNVDQMPSEQNDQMLGEQGAELSRQLMPLAERMAALVYDEFESLDALPAAYDTYPEESTAAGWWVVPHHIAYASLDYSAPEEILMHKAGIEEDLKLIAESEGEDAVDSQLDALLHDLEEMREDVKAGRTRFQDG